MYLLFMICGFLFVIGTSIILNYLYELFPINKITNFLSPSKDTTFNQIGIIIIPNIIWSLIEISVLGTNYYFLLGFFLNIFISTSVIYIIKYGYKLLNENKNNIINVSSIIIGSTFGFSINYISLLIGITKKCNLTTSLLGIAIFIIFYLILKINPPKSEFFQGKKE